ncbi:MAG: HEPN domain-containing protein [Thermomicrobiales bacterium]|nr:HEPN domain-containing protein [Thermomicrobiales bacterium]
MSERGDSELYLLKAEECLSGAESEFANRRYQNCANRAYYACYQASVAGLLRAGIRPSGSRWGHDTVQALFVGELINRRKQYPSNLRDTFERLFLLRQTGDYAADFVSEIQAARALRRARDFVSTVRQVGGNRL